MSTNECLECSNYASRTIAVQFDWAHEFLRHGTTIRDLFPRPPVHAIMLMCIGSGNETNITPLPVLTISIGCALLRIAI